VKFAIKPIQHLITLGRLTLPWEIKKVIFLVDIQQTWKKMQSKCIFSASILIPICMCTHVAVYAECIYVLTEYLKYLV